MRVLRAVARVVRLAAHPTLLARVLAIASQTEHARTTGSPSEAVSAARARGLRAARRAPRGRARLRRVIARVDALFPGGPNCYRRTLLEASLDRGAAEEKIHFGLDVGKTGHAWLDSDPARQTYDVTFTV